MRVPEDLTSIRFGRLSVMSKLPSDNFGHARWFCICDCGNTTNVLATNLKTNQTHSCGCINKEIMSTHGLSASLAYSSWKCMIQRCTNKNHKHYHDYGGRGITVCERWIKSFENFFEDMGTRPDKQHTLDRIRVNEGYHKDNCRWATLDIQAKNKRPKKLASLAAECPF